jgi:serine/threonine-protein kinase
MSGAPSDDSNVAAGSVLSGRYRVVRLLGQGAIGRVYEVQHLQVGRRFAAKVLKGEHRDSAVLRARFRQEAKLGGKLRSPYSVAVVDYDESGETPFFVMEYLEGETLQALVAREGPLPVRRAALLLVQACRGVRAAHAFGVLHRDLKPSNLFVTDSEAGEVCKVLDFGIAKTVEQGPSSSRGPDTATGAVIGTLHYMPPEQLRGEGDLDERVDVYALGSIFYECLSGKRAFEASTPSALMYKILEESAEPLGVLRPELPAAVVSCVERAMARDRRERTLGIEHFERELLAFTAVRSDVPASDATAPGTEVSPLERTRERRSFATGRKTLPLVATAVLAGSISAVLGYQAALSSGIAPRASAATGEVPALPRAAQALAPAASSTPPRPSPPASATPLGPTPSAGSPRRAAAPFEGPPARANRHAAPAASATPVNSSDSASFDRRNPYRAAP